MLNVTANRITAAKQHVVGHLEQICQHLELTDAQYSRAETLYDAVGEYLTASGHPIMSQALIYPQGSISLRTPVRPLSGNEFDVDLVCYIPNVSSATTPPNRIKALVGETLRLNTFYNGILTEKDRCWRLNFANEFHMDITPSIMNPLCSMEGELVPDKKTAEWKASNPKGYRSLFDRRADNEPVYHHLQKAMNRTFEAAEQVTPLPDQEPRFKGTLRRCVQIFKRHRDQYFEPVDCKNAPISVIITTLAAQSYEACLAQSTATNTPFDSEFDVLIAVLQGMPSFIDRQITPSGTVYRIMNETTKGENFAEKWNQDPALPKNFYDWHTIAMRDLGTMADIRGNDNLRKSMSLCFGESVVASSFDREMTLVNESRNMGVLSVVPGIGLATTSSTMTKSGLLIPPNTFHGVEL